MTRQLCWLQQATVNTGLFTCPLPASTTMYAKHITMVLCYWVSSPFPKVHLHSTNTYCCIGTKSNMKLGEFHHCHHQIFHSAITCILQSLKTFMTEPKVVWCPDDHFYHAIYSLSPYIGDYPEQCLLSCIVQGWCTK